MRGGKCKVEVPKTAERSKENGTKAMSSQASVERGGGLFKKGKFKGNTEGE